MIFSINRDYLLNKLNIIQRGLPIKTPMPVLYGIKFNVNKDNIVLTSSNTDIAIQVILDKKESNIKVEGKTLVPGKYLIDIVRKVNSNIVEFSLIETNLLIIKADRSEFKLRLLDVEDYPDIEFIQENSPIIFQNNELKKIIRETSYATSNSEKRPVLTGVDLKFENQKLTCVATDSYRLARKEIDFDLNQNTFDIIVPNKSLDELFKILESTNENIELYTKPNKILFKFEKIMFQTRLLEGQYPDTSRIIPKEYLIEIPFHKEQLISAIDRVSLLSPKEKETNINIIRLSLREDKIVEISSTNTEIGDALEELIPSGEIKGKKIKLAFSSKYLKEALKVYHSDEVLLKFSGETKPFIITGKSDPSLVNLILPVRID